MSAQETGAYIRLLCFQWGNGKISDDKSTLERIAGGPVSDFVLSKFPNGKNRRMEKERRKQSEYRAKQRLNGMLGGRPVKPKPNPTLSDENNLSLSFGLLKTEPKKSSPSPPPIDLSLPEPPHGFPKTEKEAAIHAEFIGCSEQFAIRVWNKAMSRNGFDSKGQPIRSFRHYLQTDWVYEQERQAQKLNAKQSRSAGTFNEKTIGSLDHIKNWT